VPIGVKEYVVDKVMPIVAICAVGLAACVGYLLFVAVRALRRRFGKEKETFELEDNTLVVDLKEYKRNKRNKS